MPTGVYKRTAEHRKKLSESAKKSTNSGSFKKGSTPWNKGRSGYLSEEAIEKLRKARAKQGGTFSGHKHTEESKQKMSRTRKGLYAGEKSHRWAGDKIGYSGVHTWVRKVLGTPNYCERCGTKANRVYHWANIDHQYKRFKEDWMRLCVPCHRKYDNQRTSGES